MSAVSTVLPPARPCRPASNTIGRFPGYVLGPTGRIRDPGGSGEDVVRDGDCP